LVYRLLEQWNDENFGPLLPEQFNAGSSATALRQIHFPKTIETLAAAREHLILAEFFAMQMLISSRRAQSAARNGRAHCGSGKLLEFFLRLLPFDLTAAQERVIAEIRSDLAAIAPMNRLLQGDVGSGKTVVAIAAMLLAVEAVSRQR
jgi:ATP-dependent DNA helicase RecG